MIKFLRPQTDVPAHYEDKDNGRSYSRVLGGLAWPVKERPGFIVVLAKDLEPDSAGQYHYWRLAESESADIGQLIRSAIDMRQEYQAKTWMGNVQNKPAMYLLSELMRDRNYKERLLVDMAPHASDAQGLSFYMPLIKECTRVNHKVLHLGESALPGHLNQASNEDLSRPPEDFPPIAALGYALAELYGFRAEVVDNTVDYSSRASAWML